MVDICLEPALIMNPVVFPVFRYYESKFDVTTDNIEFRHKLAREYVLGLCWVLRYYYQVNTVGLVAASPQDSMPTLLWFFCFEI